MNRRFFGLLCAHKWSVVAQYEHTREWQSGKSVKRPAFELRCDHCGAMRTKYVGERA